MPGQYDQGWERVAIAASGPSFTAEQADALRDAQLAGAVRVIAVNSTVLTRTPFADAVYFADAAWRNYYTGRTRAAAHQIALDEFTGQRWTSDAAIAETYGDRFIRMNRCMTKCPGLSQELDAIGFGGNSGYQAINLAYLFGARRILLVGFDMQLTGGAIHHHGAHPTDGEKPRRLRNPPAAAFPQWAARFHTLADDLKAQGVDVLNCTITSALQCFERRDLRTALELSACPA